ncbi:hypothetical protein QBC38DRAFT_521519 [Podospora fimiseda]|uniref:CCHC-type domain-containing protein n=1 Tax=Podospora fimiseda TaxID=252190 RepID=A0AAN7BTC2_9PEZI|nr:hypothetical protein QBC38DRAFT_521519 [Podospora fimiseda]
MSSFDRNNQGSSRGGRGGGRRGRGGAGGRGGFYRSHPQTIWDRQPPDDNEPSQLIRQGDHRRIAENLRTGYYDRRPEDNTRPQSASSRPPASSSPRPPPPPPPPRSEQKPTESESDQTRRSKTMADNIDPRRQGVESATRNPRSPPRSRILVTDLSPHRNLTQLPQLPQLPPDESQEEYCENCGRQGHLLSRCVKLDPQSSDLHGCPMCETTAHSFDNCRTIPRMESRDFFEYLVERRGGRGPIRTRKYDWLNYVKNNVGIARYPWTRQYAKEWQRNNPTFWENYDYLHLPYWIGVEIDPLTATKERIVASIEDGELAAQTYTRTLPSDAPRHRYDYDDKGKSKMDESQQLQQSPLINREYLAAQIGQSSSSLSSRAPRDSSGPSNRSWGFYPETRLSPPRPSYDTQHWSWSRSRDRRRRDRYDHYAPSYDNRQESARPQDQGRSSSSRRSASPTKERRNLRPQSPPDRGRR